MMYKKLAVVMAVALLMAQGARAADTSPFGGGEETARGAGAGDEPREDLLNRLHNEGHVICQTQVPRPDSLPPQQPAKSKSWFTFSRVRCASAVMATITGAVAVCWRQKDIEAGRHGVPSNATPMSAFLGIGGAWYVLNWLKNEQAAAFSRGQAAGRIGGRAEGRDEGHVGGFRECLKYAQIVCTYPNKYMRITEESRIDLPKFFRDEQAKPDEEIRINADFARNFSFSQE